MRNKKREPSVLFNIVAPTHFTDHAQPLQLGWGVNTLLPIVVGGCRDVLEVWQAARSDP